jgi:hypothetical protein
MPLASRPWRDSGSTRSCLSVDQVVGPTADTVITPGISAGATRQLVRTSRSTVESGGQSGLMSSVVG